MGTALRGRMRMPFAILGAVAKIPSAIVPALGSDLLSEAWHPHHWKS